jgi:phthalate 3,4-dioxygenase ferredoxin reductase subunit
VTSAAVIVGASVGGVHTARALRADGYGGEVVLVGAENALPYDKPPLSKELLAGRATAEGICLLTAEQAAEADIRLALGTAAVRLDTAERRVELADGSMLPYSDLVIATGARPRPSPWGEPAGVHILRTLEDSVDLGEDLRRGGPLVVVGAGFIGAEVAATARGLGVEDVTIVDPIPVPLGKALDVECATALAELHSRHGVATRFGVGVSGIDPVGDRLAVRLTDGSELTAATVVVGIGVVPNVEWLADSGLRLDNGVVCDEYSRSVTDPHVHAVGDVARWLHPRYQQLTRVEHWTNAVDQADCVAHNIVHPDQLRAHDAVPYAWTDQYDWKVQLVGRTGADYEQIRIDNPGAADSFTTLYAGSGGEFVGAVVANWPRALITCRRTLKNPGSVGGIDEARRLVEGVRTAPKTNAGAAR